MKNIEIKKMKRVEAPAGEYEDIVAFQMVEFTVDFYGNKQVDLLDTKIMADGSQFVIAGNGWIPDGYEVAA